MSRQIPFTRLAALAFIFSLAVGRTQGQEAADKPAAAPECVPVPDGIVGWWSGDRGTKDRLGRSNGYASEGLTFAKGKVGKAFSFDVADAFVEIPPLPNLDIGKGISIECWIRPNTSALYPIVDWNDGQGHLGVHLWVFDGIGRLYFNVIGPQWEGHVLSSGPGVVRPDVFQHIAATYDMESGLARLYRNGVLMAEDYLGKFRPHTESELYFGFRPLYSEHFRGDLDEGCVYNRSLTATEVQAIYNAGSAGYCLPGEEKAAPATPARE